MDDLHHQDREEGLECDREPPAHRRVALLIWQEVEPVANPVRDHDTSHNESAGRDDEFAALCRFRTLGLPGRNR